MKKNKFEKSKTTIVVPTGIHARPDVLWVMQKVGDEAAKIIKKRSDEYDKHGIVISHFEHGLFSWGRSVEEAFENAYRASRNAEVTLLSKLL